MCLAIFIITAFPAAGSDGLDAAKQGLTDTANTGYGGTQGLPSDIPSLIGTVVGTALSFVGVLFLLLMIYGGFQWMTARGNNQQVDKAKDLIYSAVIGLIIIFAAYAITNYIGNALTSSNTGPVGGMPGQY